MRRLLYIHSAPLSKAEGDLRTLLYAAEDWQVQAISDETSSSELSAEAARGAEFVGVLISGSSPQLLSRARTCRNLWPGCTILFVAEEEQFSAIRRQLGIAPMLGANWALVPADLVQIRQAIAKAEERAGRQQRVRTTLQRMGERLAAPSLKPETRFQKQMLSERYLLGVLSHGFDAVVCFSDRQTVIAWNAAAESMFELPEAEALGATLQDLSSCSVLSTIAPAVQAALKGEPLQRLERRVSKAGGLSCFYEITVVTVREEGRSPGAVLIGRDITERRHAEEQIRRERAWLQTTLGSIGDAVIATDASGRVVFMNAVAEALTGWKSFQAQGLPLNQVFVIVNEDTRATVESPVDKVIREGTVVGLANHTLLIRRDGSESPIDDSAAPIQEGGTMHGVVLVFRDVTEGRAAERQIIAARDEAERATKAKDRFLAVLSHELRTPLTPVFVLLDSLASRSELPTDVRSDLQLIRRNVMMEARLVDDLLDINRISQGKLQLHVELVDLHRTLEYAIEICHTQAAEKSVRVATEFQSPRHHTCGDLSRLQQVFWNLIQNAVKFTPAGGTITVGTASEDDQSIVISVQDTGVGISADVLPKVFDAFEQGTTAVTRQFGGLGLGLAICRALVDAHGGAIWATSPGPGQGATFKVRLELATEADCDAAPASAAPSPGAKTSLRILLAEDHEDTRAILQRLLMRRGHHVVVAGTVQAALAIGAQESLDLLISDIGLPDGSGTELIRAMHALSPGLKGIALSGFGLEEDIGASISAGFSAHLTKPVNLQQLEDAIQRLS